MKFRLSDAPLERADAELAVLVVASDKLSRLRQQRSAGPGVGRDLERQRFTGAEGTSVLLRQGRGARPLAIVGVGASTTAGVADAYRRAGDQTIARAREARARTIAVAFLAEPTRLPVERPEALAAFVEGAALTAYGFTEYKSSDKDRVPITGLTLAQLVAPRDAALRRALRNAEILADATNAARTWINQPAAVLTPAAFAADAERAARAAGLTVTVDGPAAIRRLGMGALLGVARGSAEEPRFVRVTYRPPPARRSNGGAATARLPRLALVGKGITFDSGGLSLKRPDGMEHMKRDMAGGAAVLGAMLAIAKLAPAAEVRAYVPMTENMPGGSAMKPGDVLRTPSGKTVEVLNTDAEGRLVLADALTIALADEPDALVDIATLTGAVRSALGNRIGGILGNDAELVAALIAAGKQGGERLWELPLVRAYRADLESQVADLANVAAEGHGGAIHAALFLEEFVGGRPWAHMDVAGVAFTDRDIPNAPRGGVGFGVRLLARWVLRAAAAAQSAK